MGPLDSVAPNRLDERGAESERLVAGSGRPGALALLEVIDRDGHVRQAWPIRAWPARIGRGLDNDIVLTDPYVAAHHFGIEAVDGGLALRVGDSVNGVTLAGRHVERGGVVHLPREKESIDIVAGRTRLHLRLADAALAAELPLATITLRHLRLAPTLVLALLLLASLAFNTWLDADPDNFGRALGNALLTGLTAAAIWCGAWALLSKTITRQAHLGWHVRVFTIAALSLLALAVVPGLLAFALSWPWLTDFSFVATFAVGAAALYFHLLAAEPARPRLLGWVVATGALVGIGLTLWFNVQRTSRVGEELYMSHLYPPALRIARPLATDRFIEGLAPLHALLDRKAKEPAGADPGAAKGEDDDE
jgi:hypothetical protein